MADRKPLPSSLRAPENELEARYCVMEGCRVLADQGQSNFAMGFLSVRDPGGRGMWMKPGRLGFEEVRVEDVILVSYDGEVLEGSGARHGEFRMHAAVFEARPEVWASVHTHSEDVVVFGSLEVPLRSVGIEGAWFVPPDLPRYRDPNLIHTTEQAKAVVEALGDGRAALLTNHGLVTAGVDVCEAVVFTVVLDIACRKMLKALATGLDIPTMTDDELLLKRTQVSARGPMESAWRYMCRKTGIETI